MPFDLAGARKEGYSDDEIAAHLAQTQGFDIDGARKSGYSSTEIINHLSQAPIKIGHEGYGDALRETLRGTDWGTRNIASAGQSVKNLYEGAKQLLTGDVDPNAVAEAKSFAQEAPVGSILGTVAATAPAMLIPGANTIAGAAAAGGATGLLQPDEEGRAGQFRSGAVGGVLGAAGQKIGQSAAGYIGDFLARRAVQQQARAVSQATIAAGQDLGMVATPSSAGAGLVSRMLEGLSGKARTEQAAVLKNQQVADSVARRALGLPEDAQLTQGTMQAIRRQAYQDGYEPVAQAGLMPTDTAYEQAVNKLAARYQGAASSFPGAISDDAVNLLSPFRVKYFDAGDALQASQFLRDKAADAFRQGNSGLGKAAREMSKLLEDQIERNLSASGHAGADLLAGFREARKRMAVSHTIEDAIQEGTGSVNQQALARRVQAGKPMSGDLETVARFANANKNVTRLPKSGDANEFSVWDYAAAAAGAAHTPALLGLPLARVAARRMVTAPWFQRAFVHANDGENALLRFVAKDPELVGQLSGRLSAAAYPSVSAR